MNLFILFLEFDRKLAAECFWWGELEEELRDLGWISYKFHTDSDREKCMNEIETERSKTLYPHAEEDCTLECKQRGTN